MKLYTYFRSSTAYRVRTALAVKGLDYEAHPINLLKSEQLDDAYKKVNPMAGVPALEHDGKVISQSLAIIEYLEDVKPLPSLLPGSAADKAFARQIAQAIGTDVHPLINLRTMKYLGDKLGADEAAKKDWTAHWVMKGMHAVEAMLATRGGVRNTVLGGDVISMADLCIIPQMYSMRRNGLPVEDLPICCAIERYCITLEPFIKASPEMQQDALPDLEPIHGPHAPLLKHAA
ncbi:MAG: maleylacetoacetate isomerase [Alphaproteobacteria bacterium]|nr:maleylacetoacetate isomerase [Alphaproteobacteria bacterium]MCD8570464.1 maleylacetoacetate isomerase [Alphaproteobacteria bacterium]